MISPDAVSLRDKEFFWANQIDLICDEFESSWKASQRPQISEYLSRVDGQSRSDLLVELVRLDYDYRVKEGETPVSDDYVSLFPDYSEVILTRVNEFSSIGKYPSKAPLSIGEIELLERVGYGAFGEVWRAWDRKLKRQVAVKLPVEKLQGAQQVDLFLHEAQAAAKLHHPNIVPVYSSGQIDGRGYIVFKYIEGKTLRKQLQDQPVSYTEAARICMALAGGLEHAHQQGVIHRDLKPVNILMDESGEPHITDFGLAKRIDMTASLAHSGTVLGTLAYMSPEQARGRSSEIDGTSDIYSLGAILYRMLTSKVPFEGEPHELLQQILNTDPVEPGKIDETIPRDLETICLKAISRFKQDRYQSASEMAADLQRFLNDQPIQARRISLPQKAWRRVSRRHIIWGMAACLFLMSAPLGMRMIAPVPNSENHPIVTLNTKPEGASLAFIPLSKRNGEPLPEQIIHAEATSPVTMPLKPGDYLVVAYLDDQRFHEVYRHVPDSTEVIPAGFAHRFFTRDREDPNQIKLLDIRIPKASVTEGMAWIEGKDRFPVGSPDNQHIPVHHRSMPGFWIDPREMTEGEFIRISKTNPPLPTREEYVPQKAAVLNYDLALYFAERSGKRLLTEFEFEYAATNFRGSEPIWDQALNEEDQAQLGEFLQAGQPAFDWLNTSPSVLGIFSNVAEWTSSQLAIYPSTFSEPSTETAISLQQHRVVRGGTRDVIEGDPGITKELRDPFTRTPIHRSETHPGLGVRFARSSKPRLKPEDFIQIVK